MHAHPHVYVHAHAQRFIMKGVDAGSPEARAYARECFVVFAQCYPKQRTSMLEQISSRTRKLIAQAEQKMQLAENDGDVSDHEGTGDATTRASSSYTQARTQSHGSVGDGHGKVERHSSGGCPQDGASECSFDLSRSQMSSPVSSIDDGA